MIGCFVSGYRLESTLLTRSCSMIGPYRAQSWVRPVLDGDEREKDRRWLDAERKQDVDLQLTSRRSFCGVGSRDIRIRGEGQNSRIPG